MSIWRFETITSDPHIEVDPDRCGGVPVLRGTRFKVARLLAELADGRSVQGIAEDFDLDHRTIIGCLEGLAVFFERK